MTILQAQTFEIDVSDFVSMGSLDLIFEYFPDYYGNSFFDIGAIAIYDIDSREIPYYEYNEGTSFAAPVVTGVASLIMSHRPDLLASDVKKILLDSAVRKSNLELNIKSGGIVNASKAIDLANS